MKSCICVRGTKPVKITIMYLCVRGTKPVKCTVMYLCVRGAKPVKCTVMYLCQGYQASKVYSDVFVC